MKILKIRLILQGFGRNGKVQCRLESLGGASVLKSLWVFQDEQFAGGLHQGFRF